MSETLVWWLMTQVVGLAALPLCLTLFRRLPDRGYTLSKAFALLLVGYVFWILNMVRILPNSTGGIVWVLVLLFAASLYVGWRRRDDLLTFWRERWWLIYATELLFFVAFIMAAYLRSYVPDIGGTEKPMDFMFLNAVTRAENFPPPDPWLSGSNVSYYYFGYLLISVMTRLSGLETSIGFNLGLSMIAALAAIGAFGLVYNLTALREQRAATGGPGAAEQSYSDRVLWRPMLFGFAAALLLLVMGNLAGALEWLAAHNIGSSGFWEWVGIRELTPYESSQWYPDRFWFWWKSTRILDGGAGIHEFPFFSFLLGDLHPHVMSIPFVLLAIGIAFSIFRSDEPLDLVVWLERPFALLAFGVILGGLAFLNTWDMPTMAFVVALAALLRNRLLAERWSGGLFLDTAGFLLPLFFVAFLAYTPFFFGGFDSQAAGFTPEVGNGSGLFHTFLLWGPFAILVLPYALWRLRENGGRLTVSSGLVALAPLVAVLFLWVIWDVLAKALGWLLPPAIEPNEGKQAFWNGIAERGWNWLTVIVLGGALGTLALALVREVEAAKRTAEERTGHVLALALAATAALLIVGVEFVYIQDGFNSRLNTIFKLYYQAWLLLSIAGGFALYELTRLVRMPQIEAGWRYAWGGAAAVLLVAAFVYPLIATWNRTDGCVGHPARFLEAPPEGRSCAEVFAARSLDGLAALKRNRPSEYNAIRWLSELDGQPVIAEALGDDYTEGGRVSAATGLPTPLQWPGHQLQWRGTSEPQTGRPEDLEALYTSTDAAQVRSIVQKYGIAYVVVGSIEREKYPDVTLSTMSDLFQPAFEEGDVVIYQVRPEVLSQVTQE
jgi:YYY domain-containing protein